jgi:deoxyribodipyrimidine photo-lyase
MTTIVWLRDDLRVADNPALTAAAQRQRSEDHGPVIVLYLLDEVSPGIRALGGASRWWLHHSLEALGRDIPLTLRTGAAADVLPALVRETGATAVYWNRRYGAARDVDAALKEHFRADGVEAQSFQANLLFEPWTVRNGSGEPYRVFTPFWRAARELDVRDPLPAPADVEYERAPSDDLDDWHLLPTRPDWSHGLAETFTPGEPAAHERLEAFVEDDLEHYDLRDEPAREVTSMLSPRLRFGEISPFQVWERVHRDVQPAARKNVAKFLSELGWREFNWNILFHHPGLATKNYRAEFDAFEWGEPTDLEAWQRGRTGIPLVDAGMRELWRTGYMHNRIRMVTASFLVKNLLIDWREGERWFWDTLCDADEANNAANWQWVAGSGADAAPYFRVFNPELQAAKFDPRGEYVRRWVPEVGTDLYPEPIVDLAETRRRALAAYERMRSSFS